MQLLVPFADIIYISNLKNFEKDNKYFYDTVLELSNTFLMQQDWNCTTFNYEFFPKNLIDEIFVHLKNFAEHYSVMNKTFTCVGSWINLAKKGDYQEYHIHPNSHFSAVYYVKVPKNSGRIIFKKSSADGDMFPIMYKNCNQVNSSTYTIIPNECDLLIFRSNLQHMVEKNRSDEDRVSISMNFTIND